MVLLKSTLPNHKWYLSSNRAYKLVFWVVTYNDHFFLAFTTFHLEKQKGTSLEGPGRGLGFSDHDGLLGSSVFRAINLQLLLELFVYFNLGSRSS